MRFLSRFAVLFALLVPVFAKADVTFTLEHSARGERSFFQLPSDSTETVSGVPNRAARVPMDFSSLHESFESSFDQEEGRPFRPGSVHVIFDAEDGLKLRRSDRDSRTAETFAAVVGAPEPGSLALLAAGLAGCAALRRRHSS